MRRLKRADDIDDVFDQMEDLFKQVQQKGMGLANDIGGGFPVDISEEDGTFHLTADMPGVEKEEIDLRADENSVEITAESSHEVEEENEKYYRRERSRRSFSRRVEFPQPVDPETIEAGYEDGVLTITADKAEEDGMEIEIE